jgi:hypothetical protein
MRDISRRQTMMINELLEAARKIQSICRSHSDGCFDCPFCKLIEDGTRCIFATYRRWRTCPDTWCIEEADDGLAGDAAKGALWAVEIVKRIQKHGQN